MKKIFITIAVAAVVAISAVGAGFYWLSTEAMTSAKRDALMVVAKGLAQVIAKETASLSESVQRLAEREDVRLLVKQKDVAGLTELSSKLDGLHPDIMKIRILLPETIQLDTSNIPHFGYADLQIAQATLKGNQQPFVQGDKGPNRHLAIARGVEVDGQIAAVMFASLKYDFMRQVLADVAAKSNRIELKQGNVALAVVGKAIEQSALTQSVQVAGTQWKVNVSQANGTLLADWMGFVAIGGGALLLIILLFLFGFRKMISVINSDLHSLVKVTKDMLSGKVQGNYPTHSTEFQETIAEISRLKKTNDSQNSRTQEIRKKAEEQDQELTLHDFFGEFADDDKTFNEMAVFDLGDSEQSDSAINQMEEPLQEPEPQTLEPSSYAFGLYQISDKYGVIVQTADISLLAKIAKAVASDLRQKGFDSVVLARDGFAIEPKAMDDFQKGLISTGIDVVDIGEVPIPALYFAAHYHPSHTGIMFCGTSRAKPDYSIKIIIDGELISKIDMQRCLQRVESNDFIVSPSEGVVNSDQAMIKEYIDVICQEVEVTKPMTLVIDCGNGSASTLAPQVIKRLGCKLIELNCDSSGECSGSGYLYQRSVDEVLHDLKAAVAQHQADLGFAIFGDGERLDVIDSEGNPVSPDRLICLFGLDVLKLIPDAKIIHDPMCSQQLPAEIKKKGGQALMIKSSVANFRTQLKQQKASFTGGMSGRFCFNDRWFGFDDAIYSAARLLEILSLSQVSPNETFQSAYTSMPNVYYSLAMNASEATRFIDKLAEAVIFPEGKITCLDCLRVDFDDGWGVVSIATVIPGIAIRFEAEDEQALARIGAGFKRYMLEVKPGMKVPY